MCYACGSLQTTAWRWSNKMMLPVTIETLVVGMLPSPSVVVLRPKGTEDTPTQVLPIWIGPAEAMSIGVALEGQTQQRPMTHDLLAHTISALEASVERVVIDRVEGSTFYATVYLNHQDEVIGLDARPSDSIALALRTNTPLFVDEAVFAASSYPYDLPLERNSEATMAEFHSFIESISPEDFSRVE
jgi:bifunctional DNase/RNase